MGGDARLTELARILRGHFGDALAECWLRWPNRRLNGRAPRDVLLNYEIGAVLAAAREEIAP